MTASGCHLLAAHPSAGSPVRARRSKSGLLGPAGWFAMLAVCAVVLGAALALAT